MEVDHAACLVLRDLHIPDGQDAAQFGEGQAGAGEMAGQVGGEPAPQVSSVRVEQHGGVIVVAVRARGAAEPRIAVGVAAGAGDVAAVRAAAGVRVAAGTAGQGSLSTHPPGMDRAERGCGQGGEHARMLRDGLRDALAAGQPSTDELAGVALVDLGAGRAHGLAPVAARGQQHPAGLGSGVVDGREFTGGQVDSVDAAPELDRVGAAAGRGELAFGVEEVSPGDRVGVVGGFPRSPAHRVGQG